VVNGGVVNGGVVNGGVVGNDIIWYFIYILQRNNRVIRTNKIHKHIDTVICSK
jgi:hypothetical protein